METLRKRAQCGGCQFRLQDNSESTLIGSTDKATFRSASNQRLSVPLITCPRCSLRQTSGELEGSDLEAAYAEATDDEHSSQFNHRRSSFERALVANVFPFVPSESRSPWLDVGTAGGAFVDAARRLGIDAVGLEPSSHIVDSADSLVRPYLRQGFLSDLQHGEQFSVISYWDVLEHVADPYHEVQRIKQHLLPNGYLVLNLPMVDTMSARLLRRRWPFYLDVHLFYFTRKSVVRFLTELGFEVVSIRHYSQTLDLRYLLSRYVSRVRIPSVLSRVPVRYLMGQRTIVARCLPQ